ncbi:MAG TPA: RDD family protein [Longimicrobiales bacterium]|nr:RDD family protein [Longimicrobiales bacterium]
MRPSDPRHIVTPDAFSVAPELLGIRLAEPWRRLVAIGIDALLVAVIARTSLVVLLALIVALVLWRALAPSSSRSITRRAARLALQLTMALFAFVLVLKLWSAIRPAQRSADAGHPPAAESAQVTQPGTGTVAVDAETVAIDAETAEVDAESAAVEALANTQLTSLNAENEQLRRRNRELESRLAAAEDESGPVRAFFSEIADELGVGLGWFGFYFTALTVLGRGQTPGKRMLKIRVIRLDARPVGWWIAFERFGGYAASFFSGTLGFAQILWDRNRQALHDKATETVVIRVENGEPLRRA